MTRLPVRLRLPFVLLFSLFSSLFLFTSSAFCMQNIIVWDPNSEPDLAGYKVYVGFSPGVYTSITDVGLSTQLNLSSLPQGNTYYLAVTAYNLAGNESPPSQEVSVSLGGGGGGGSNAAPVASNDSHSTPENVTLSVPPSQGLLLNDSDPDGDPLTVSQVTSPSHGELTLQPNGSFQYVPTQGFSGADTFIYNTSDGRGGNTQARVNLTVTSAGGGGGGGGSGGGGGGGGGGSNTAPVAFNDSHSTSQNSILWVPLWRGLLLNDRDPDGDPLTATPVTNPSHGELTLLPNGTFQYIPFPGFSGSDTFIYNAGDGRGGNTQARVNLTVQ